MSRRAIMWLAVSVLVVCGLGCLVFVPFTGSPLQRALIKLPRTRDPRLVGTWTGSWQFLDEPVLRSRETILRSDGRGSTWDERGLYAGFDWGTEAGVLYTRRMAVDSWSASHHAYTSSPDGNSVDSPACGCST